MARTKGSKNKVVPKEEVTVETTDEIVEVVAAVVPTPIDFLSVDYPSEGLNNMAKKINEIITKINPI